MKRDKDLFRYKKRAFDVNKDQEIIIFPISKEHNRKWNIMFAMCYFKQSSHLRC